MVSENVFLWNAISAKISASHMRSAVRISRLEISIRMVRISGFEFLLEWFEFVFEQFEFVLG